MLVSLSALSAQAAEVTMDEDFVSDLPIVLSASRLYQPTNQAPAAITVIDRAMIDASGARQIPDLFLLVPGFQVGHVNGNSATVMRGIGDGYSRQMQVLIDGRSIYSPLYGGVEWTEIPITLDDIERVEVVRGPNAASFGANSFLGVINIITREPGAEHNDEVILTAGEYGNVGATLRKIGGEGPLRYRVTLAQNTDGGFGGTFDASRVNLLNARGNYQISPTDQVEAQLGYVDGMRQQGYAGQPTNGPRTQNSDSWYLQTRWTQRGAADVETWLQYVYSERNALESFPVPVPQTLAPPAPPIPISLLYPGWPTNVTLDYSNRQKRHEIELQHSKPFGEAWRVSMGAQVRQDSVNSAYFFGTNDWQNSNLLRLFGHLEWRPGAAWTLNIGTMYEKTSLTGGAFSPRVAANWEFVKGQTLRASWSRAERTPSMMEAKNDQTIIGGPYTLLKVTVPNRAIRAETGDIREVGYLAEFPALNLSLDMRAFRENLAELIASTSVTYPGPLLGRVAGAWTNRNQAEIRGHELSLRWLPWAGAWVYLATSNTQTDSDYSRIRNGAPDHTLSLLAEQRLFDDWRVSAGFYRVGSFYWQGGTGSVAQRGYDRLDLRMARSFAWSGGRGDISVTTQNIAHADFDYFRSLVPRRTTHLRVDLPF